MMGPLWFWEMPPDPDRLGGYRCVALRHSSGEPLRAGDLAPNSVVYYDPITGFVLKIEKPLALIRDDDHLI